MTRKRDPIPPFPADIDRHAFGHYLSGLTDGEGCFRLGLRTGKNRRPTPTATFAIKLRADDGRVLQLAQSFFACGLIYSCRPYRKEWSPQLAYRVIQAGDLCQAIVPHFETHTLWAKKGNDFLTWRDGVRLIDAVQHRRRKRGYANGTLPRWKDGEIEHFAALTGALQSQRLFTQNGHPLPPQPPPPKGEGPTLFDCLSD